MAGCLSDRIDFDTSIDVDNKQPCSSAATADEHAMTRRSRGARGGGGADTYDAASIDGDNVDDAGYGARDSSAMIIVELLCRPCSDDEPQSSSLVCYMLIIYVHVPYAYHNQWYLLLQCCCVQF